MDWIRYADDIVPIRLKALLQEPDDIDEQAIRESRDPFELSQMQFGIMNPPLMEDPEDLHIS